MNRRILGSILAGICLVMFSGVGTASATVLPTTVVVVTNGVTIVPNPPIAGP